MAKCICKVIDPFESHDAFMADMKTLCDLLLLNVWPINFPPANITQEREGGEVEVVVGLEVAGGGRAVMDAEELWLWWKGRNRRV